MCFEFLILYSITRGETKYPNCNIIFRVKPMCLCYSTITVILIWLVEWGSMHIKMKVIKFLGRMKKYNTEKWGRVVSRYRLMIYWRYYSEEYISKVKWYALADFCDIRNENYIYRTEPCEVIYKIVYRRNKIICTTETNY